MSGDFVRLNIILLFSLKTTLVTCVPSDILQRCMPQLHVSGQIAWEFRLQATVPTLINPIVLQPFQVLQFFHTKEAVFE